MINRFKILSIELLLNENNDNILLNEADQNSFLSWITNSGLWNWFKGTLIGTDYKTGNAVSSGAMGKATDDFLKGIGDSSTILKNMVGSIPHGKLNGDQIKAALDSAKNLGIDISKSDLQKGGLALTKKLLKADQKGQIFENSPLNIGKTVSTQIDQAKSGIFGMNWVPDSVKYYLREYGNITTGVAAAAGILGLIYLYKKFLKNPNKKLDKQTALYAQKLNNIQSNQLPQNLQNKVIL